jgi:ArsR family transcriptional regulator, arsenate/arsenite/antimonite-responsive transcriptional repressor
MSKQVVILDTAAGSCCPSIAEAALNEDQAYTLAPMFRALGDPIRLRLLSMIASAEAGEICVCQLTPGFDVSGPTISHHLKVLREAGIVDGERRGTWVGRCLMRCGRLPHCLTSPPNRSQPTVSDGLWRRDTRRIHRHGESPTKSATPLPQLRLPLTRHRSTVERADGLLLPRCTPHFPSRRECHFVKESATCRCRYRGAV